MLKSLYLILTITFTDGVLCKDYTNYTLYKAKPENNNQFMFLNNLTDMESIDFWVPPSTINHFVEFVVSPADKPYFFKEFDKENIQLTTIIYNIQSEFEQQLTDNKTSDKYDWSKYKTLNETYNWLNELQKHNEEEIEILTIGKTAEGRPIKAVKVVLKQSKKRSSVIIEGGIHGREWISPAFVTYLINAIVTAKSETDKILRDIALTYEWFFIPVLNPDGFQYTHSMDRLWVKNRYNNHGIDLNANFPYLFGTVGISANSSSKFYCGPYPFSEAESKALRDFVLTRSSNLEYYISIHAYGQFLILPYDCSKEHHDNYDEVKKMTTEVISSISSRYGTEYTTGNIFETRGGRSLLCSGFCQPLIFVTVELLVKDFVQGRTATKQLPSGFYEFLTSGSSTSWVKSAIKVPYVLTMYLRDKDMFGYALPSEQIVPTCAETLDGLLSFLQIRTPTFEKFDHVDHNSIRPIYTPLSFVLSGNATSGQKDVLMKVSVIILNILFVALVQD